MRFISAELWNWRGFEHLKVDLDRPFTLLVGANGAGKTSLLVALRQALGLFRPSFFVPDETRSVTSGAFGSLKREKLSSTLEFVVEGGGHRERLILSAGQTLKPRWPEDRQLESIVLSVDDARSAPSYDVNDPLPPSAAGIARAYEDWDRPGAPWWAIREWLMDQTNIGYERYFHASKSGNPDASLADLVPELGAATAAASALIDEAVAIEYDVTEKQLFVRFADGRIVSTEHLSAGYRNVLALAADLARRAVIANPELGANAPLETPGIVLIDELELHLHPKWQRAIVAGLMNAFPKVQFICATHSPQIIASAPQGSVVLLKPNDVVAYPDATHGRDTNAILEELLGVRERPADIAQRFDTFRAALGARQLDEAQRLLEALAQELGPNVGEVVEAEVALHFERQLGD